jgi:hypothetical protein
LDVRMQIGGLGGQTRLGPCTPNPNPEHIVIIIDCKTQGFKYNAHS